MRPAALMRGAMRKATSKPVSCLLRDQARRRQTSARKPAPTGRRNSRSPSAAITRFSPAQRDRVGNGGDGRHLQKAGQSLLARTRCIAALKHRLRQLECDGRAAQRLLRITAAGLVGIENGQRVRDGIVAPRANDGR